MEEAKRAGKTRMVFPLEEEVHKEVGRSRQDLFRHLVSLSLCFYFHSENVEFFFSFKGGVELSLEPPDQYSSGDFVGNSRLPVAPFCCQKVTSSTALEIVITSCCLCNSCQGILYDEEIMASWSYEESDLNTRLCENEKCLISIPLVPFVSGGKKPRVFVMMINVIVIFDRCAFCRCKVVPFLTVIVKVRFYFLLGWVSFVLNSLAMMQCFPSPHIFRITEVRLWKEVCSPLLNRPKACKAHSR